MQRISIPILIRGLSTQICNPWLTICQCLAILAATVVVALILARYASNRWLGDRQAVKCGFVGLSVIYALLLFGTFGFTPYMPIPHGITKPTPRKAMVGLLKSITRP